MPINRWDPFKDLNVLQDRMNRLFEDAAGHGWRGHEATSTTTWSPVVDIFETANEIFVKAEIPGVDKKDVSLHLENNVLTLKGERRFEKETKEETSSGGMCSMILRNLRPYISTKCLIKGTMSSRRSRNGGSSTGKTFRR